MAYFGSILVCHLKFHGTLKGYIVHCLLPGDSLLWYSVLIRNTASVPCARQASKTSSLYQENLNLDKDRQNCEDVNCFALP